MTEVSKKLCAIAKEMDEEYEGIVRRHNERLTTGKAGDRDRQTLQMNGRLDILARWAARLREMAAKEEFVPPKPWSEIRTPEDQGNARPCTDEEARTRHDAAYLVDAGAQAETGRKITMADKGSLTHESGDDYILEDDATAWVTVGGFSVHIRSDGSDVQVKIFEAGKEDGDPIGVTNSLAATP